jgi:periplasmic protein TonB
MLISKFDLYNPEWLEVVFENRNKEYGAYELRQHYGRNMVRAMAGTFLSLGLLCGAIISFSHVHFSERMIEVVNRPPVIPVPPITPPHVVKPPEPPQALKPQPPAQPIATTRFVTPVPSPDPVAENPPKNTDLTNAIGPVTIKGPVGPPVVPIGKPIVEGGSGSDESVHNTIGLDVMPESFGGEGAWGKFLSRNLRFPGPAQEQQVSGRVILSFIVEKDGHLSNIVVERGAGYGFDEEAVRVLKLAKAWKPGVQNGQPVRVKYTIPISFQYNEQN